MSTEKVTKCDGCGVVRPPTKQEGWANIFVVNHQDKDLCPTCYPKAMAVVGVEIKPIESPLIVIAPAIAPIKDFGGEF